MSYEGHGIHLLVDQSNQAAEVEYFPSSDGMEFEGNTVFCLQMKTSGTVVTTIEATMEDRQRVGLAPANWVDITKFAKNLNTNLDGSASYTDADTIIILDGFAATRIRIKSDRTGSGGTNTERYINWVA